MQSARGGMATDRRTCLRSRSIRRRARIRVMPIARAVRCTALSMRMPLPRMPFPRMRASRASMSSARRGHVSCRRCCAVGCALSGQNCGPSTVPSQLRAPAGSSAQVRRTRELYKSAVPVCKSVKRTLTPLSAFSPARVNKNAAITCSAHDEKSAAASLPRRACDQARRRARPELRTPLVSAWTTARKSRFPAPCSSRSGG